MFLLIISIYPNGISLIITNSTFKYVVMSIFGYSFTSLLFYRYMHSNVYNYILNHKYNSFQTAEVVSNNAVQLYFNNIINLIVLGASCVILFLTLLLIHIISPFSYNELLISLIGGSLLFLSFNYYTIRYKLRHNPNKNNLFDRINELLNIQVLIKSFKKLTIDRIMSTNNYNSKIDEPFPLTENTDYFNTLKKVNIIEESFCSGILDSYKIIALYGNWGSGKSSVIKTLMEHMDEGYHEGVVKYYNTTKSKDNNKLKKAWEISKTVCKKFQNTKEKFIPIKFDAWDYENEENIAYALLNKIFEELEKDADVKLELKLLKMKF